VEPHDQHAQRRARRSTTLRRHVRNVALFLTAGSTVSALLAILVPPVIGSENLPPVPSSTPTSPTLRGAEQAPPTPPDSATPVPEPVTGSAAAFFEDFTTPAPSGGPFATTYAQAWQPYQDGTGGKYFSGPLVSAHDGVMDVAMDGSRGAAGVFGPAETAWARTGGTFSIRVRVTGGAGNGTAIMLWPTSNDASEGELDFPEGSFAGSPEMFHHSMTPGHAASAQQVRTDASWRDWHTYTTVWEPGRSVSYFLDGDLLATITTDVPTTPHRYTFQIGDSGSAGHVLIDWVSIDTETLPRRVPPLAAPGAS